MYPDLLFVQEEDKTKAEQQIDNQNSDYVSMNRKWIIVLLLFQTLRLINCFKNPRFRTN